MNNNELLEPEHLYKTELKDKHNDTVIKFFDDLTTKSGVDVEANKLTCDKYYKKLNEIEKADKKSRRLGILLVFFILLVFVIVGIFLLIFVYKPKRKALDELLFKLKKEAEDLHNEAYSQMAPLNRLFYNSIPLELMQKTTPLIQIDRIFDVKKYELMREKYGMWDNEDEDSSTLDLISGSILGNPFVVFKDLNRKIVQQRYEGHVVISYTIGSGNNRRTVTQTLTAYVDKPKPVYSKETYLVYGSEAANKLSFSRVPSNINTFDEKSLLKYVMKHEKDLSKMAEKAMKKGGTYTPLGNSEFELFFGGLDRDNEVEYRLLMTPLAQKSLLQLMKSKEGYGDDFSFIKSKGINVIESAHSQGATLFISSDYFKGFDYKLMRENFISFNNNFFKAFFFDLAPILSIPLYQQYKSHEYIYKNNVGSNLNCFVHESHANWIGAKKFAHPETATDVILKTSIKSMLKDSDIVTVDAHSYRADKRIETVMKMGGDGRLHAVPVTWIDYVPLVSTGTINVSDLGIDNEVKFRGLGAQNVIYGRGGVVSNLADTNVDINNLKSLMKKD